MERSWGFFEPSLGEYVDVLPAQQQVESGNTGKIVAIDIETGAFEVADHVLPATNQLFKRYPEAQPWVIRIGHRAVYHFGARSLVKPK